MKDRSEFYGSLVWIFSGLVMLTYGSIGLWGVRVPGVEQLVAMLQNTSGVYLYGAAFLAIFIEGIYVVGSFVPGSTLVLVLAILSQVGGFWTFVFTILAIFIGWCCAGAVNMAIGSFYKSAVLKSAPDDSFTIQDRFWTTWFPAFRANYEVAQVAQGGHPLRVFVSSVRVRFFASLAAAGGALLVPFVIDITQMRNEEGFLSLGIVATITLVVGVVKLRQSRVSAVQELEPTEGDERT